MSRFDGDDWGDGPEWNNAWELQQQAGVNALKGKRGQAVLRELEAALLALPAPRLINGNLCKAGEVCAVGALALKRKMDAGEAREAALGWMEEEVDPSDFDSESYGEKTTEFAHRHLGIVKSLAYMIAYENDEGSRAKETEEQRHARVLAWVRSKIAPLAGTTKGNG